jgi:hypothetical protein
MLSLIHLFHISPRSTAGEAAHSSRGHVVNLLLATCQHYRSTAGYCQRYQLAINQSKNCQRYFKHKKPEFLMKSRKSVFKEA